MGNGASLKAPARLTLLAALLAGILAFSGCGMRCYKPYDVSKGESLSSICRKYGISENELRKSNRIGPDYEVSRGDRIFLPCEAVEKAGREKGREIIEIPSPRAPEQEARAISPDKEEKPAAISGAKGWTPAWPVEGKLLRKFSEGKDASANGIDIKTQDGAGVAASDEGRVSYAGTPADAYGPMVIVAHDNGYYTVYSHLGDITVKTGEKLYRGQRLGKADSDSYVHFEIRDGTRPLDPLLYLPKR